LTNPELEFPYLGCLLSGGHTMLVLVHGIGNYEVVASTVDDAIGEAFDKVAVLLELDILPNEPYGAAVERYAQNGDLLAHQFPVPLRLHSPKTDLNRSRFSFSGLKTAVRREIENIGYEKITEKDKADICASFQYVACLHVEDRIKHFHQKCKETGKNWGVKQIVMCGGTAINQTLRTRIGYEAQRLGMKLLCPPAKHCTDNGAMIAYTGMIKASLGHSDPIHTAYAHKWPLD
jgi:N6-L-threonylcarbamoyladenine synthase